MIIRMLALFVIALVIQSLVRRLIRHLGAGRPAGSSRRSFRYPRPGRRRSSQPEPAEFEVIDDEAP